MTKRAEEEGPQSLLQPNTALTILNKFLNFMTNNRAESTAKVAEYHVKRFAAWLGKNGHVKLRADRLRPKHVQEWLDSQYKGKSNSYRSLAVRNVKHAFSWAATMGYIDRDPIVAMKTPPSGVREYFLEPELWPKFIETIKCPEFVQYVTVILDSGVRPQEMHAACMRHFDPKFKSLVFAKEESKGKKIRRVIPLNPISLEIVTKLAAERKGQEEDHLFLNSEGHPWNKNSTNCQMRRIRKKLKLPAGTLCATALRHSFAYYKLTVDKTDPLIVAKMMGHRDGRMIATRYGHIEANLEFLSREKEMKSSPFLQVPGQPDFSGTSAPAADILPQSPGAGPAG